MGRMILEVDDDQSGRWSLKAFITALSRYDRIIPTRAGDLLRLSARPSFLFASLVEKEAGRYHTHSFVRGCIVVAITTARHRRGRRPAARFKLCLLMGSKN
jgi:hypothetical protein